MVIKLPICTLAVLPFSSNTLPMVSPPIIRTSSPMAMVSFGKSSAAGGRGASFFAFLSCAGLAERATSSVAIFSGTKLACAKSVKSLRWSLVSSFSAWLSFMVRMVSSIFLLASANSFLPSAFASFRIALRFTSRYFFISSYSVRSLATRAVSRSRLAFRSSVSFFSRSRASRSLSAFMSSFPTRAFARSITCWGRPVFWAISKAKLLPGLPICSIYIGARFLPSKRMAPFTRPGVSLAISFRLL